MKAINRPFVKRLQREIDDSRARGGMVTGYPKILVARHDVEHLIQLIEWQEALITKMEESFVVMMEQ